ncbi:hypothetical protein [Chryseobacterium sp. BIGb0232]|uniref:TapB family protein n=1 Tax=Chryseobacterium sp. BIGb0232 TaxID=2940598 RepID=UPI000F4847D1|nr:hypothetical protein [Chryseobacterium sp. BIGb0232]MCS4304857.1 hypothetical protein [Chryseobacterium sp. BIGb0232]ROS09718.1 hypothetical protein EDF65_4465 [Chryseobacterium nakagawai]
MEEYFIEEYNPLEKDNFWLYLKNNKTKLSHLVVDDVFFNGVNLQKVESSDGSTVLLEYKNGLSTHVIKKKAGKMVYSPPLTLSPKVVAIGGVYGYTSKVIFSIFNLNFNFGEINGSSTLLGFEDVEVPAGTFKQCLKIKSTASKKGLFPINHSLIIWFAKGVGEVKCEFSTKIAGVNTHVKKELLEAVVAGKKFPLI